MIDSHTVATHFPRRVDPSAVTDPDDARRQRRTVRDGYDALADAYGEASDGAREPVVASFLADLPAGSRVLDAGCGQGTPVLDDLPTGVGAVGLDLSAEQLRRARAATDAPLVRGDVTALPVGSGRVDAVTALHSLIHVPDAEQAGAIAEFARVTRPGGRLLLTAGTGPWAGANDDWLDAGVRMEWSIPGAETTRERLAEAGFRVTDDELVPERLDDGDGEWVYLTAERREN